MKTDRKIRVAVVGLEFGSNFIGAYLHHPDVEYVGICDVDADILGRVGDRWGITRRHADLREIVEGDQYDAVNIFTPIPQHARQAVAVLESGKHCASAVPMATTLEDLHAIVAAEKRSGRHYMMMETSVASDEFFFVEDMHKRGEFGRIQFMRGVWYHDLENHPRYWLGLPPMHYTTHPVSPMLALAGTRVGKVCCFGSGWMRQELRDNYGNPHPVETAIFRLHGTDLAMEVTAVLFHTAVEAKETFDVYGEKFSFKWATFRGDKHALVRLHPAWPDGPKTSPTTVFRMDVPSSADRLPRQLRQAGVRGPCAQLACEFVAGIVQGRPPRIDAVTAADWTAPGICAHLSAMKGGQVIEVPAFK